jgi:hypothetical protein
MSNFNKTLFILGLFFVSSCAKRAIKSVDIDSYHQTMTSDIAFLSADEMEGREIGTPGEIKASEFIADRFKQIGLVPKGDNKTYFQHFSKKIKSNPHAAEPAADDAEIKGRNVVAYIDNGAKSTVVIGAHFDHLGYGKEGSLYTGEPAIHNGADDNASGVSMLLFLASVLKEKEKQENNYIFIAFSGEEKGLWGSNYFVNHPPLPIDQINYMINMDMVGRLNEERALAVNGTGTSPVFPDLLDKANNKKLKIKKLESGVGPSDHTSFYLQNLPVLAFFTGQHSDYHKPSDDMHLLNYGGMRDISVYVLNVIEDLNDNGKLLFTKTKDESSDAPKFTVSLGVVPDYLYDGKGMRIDGVREGKPAFKADLQKGDIVLKMNDAEVFDMMSYMKALAMFKAGDSAKVLIKRGNYEILKDVKFE